jgi:hypothetical protein
MTRGPQAGSRENVLAIQRLRRFASSTAPAETAPVRTLFVTYSVTKSVRSPLPSSRARTYDGRLGAETPRGVVVLGALQAARTRADATSGGGCASKSRRGTSWGGLTDRERIGPETLSDSESRRLGYEPESQKEGVEPNALRNSPWCGWGRDRLPPATSPRSVARTKLPTAPSISATSPAPSSDLARCHRRSRRPPWGR